MIKDSQMGSNFKDILQAMSKHLAAMHPSSGGSEGGGVASKTESAWAAWRVRFDRWAVA